MGTPAAATSSFMNAFEPSSWAPSRAGAEHQSSGRPQPVGQPVDEGLLRPDHVQVGVELLWIVGDRTGDARVARRDHDVSVRAST